MRLVGLWCGEKGREQGHPGATTQASYPPRLVPRALVGARAVWGHLYSPNIEGNKQLRSTDREVTRRLRVALLRVTRSLRGVLLVAAVAGVVRCSVLLGTGSALSDLVTSHRWWLASAAAVVAATAVEWSSLTGRVPSLLRRASFVTDVAAASLMIGTPGFPAESWGWVLAAVVVPIGFTHQAWKGAAGGVVVAASVYAGWMAVHASVNWADVVQDQLVGVAVALFVIGAIAALRTLHAQVLSEERSRQVRADHAVQVASIASHDHVGDIAAARIAVSLAAAPDIDAERSASFLSEADKLLVSSQDRARETLKLLAVLVPDAPAPEASDLATPLAAAGLVVSSQVEAWTTADPAALTSSLRTVLTVLAVPEGTPVSVTPLKGSWVLSVVVQGNPQHSKLLDAIFKLAESTSGGHWGVDGGVFTAVVPAGEKPAVVLSEA